MGVYMAWLITWKKCDLLSRFRGLSVCGLASFISLLAGCNSDTYVTPDSSIHLSPPSSTFDIEEIRDEEGVCLFSPEFYQDVPIRLALTDSLGRAIGDAPVTVYVDYAGNTFSGQESMQLFSDMNGNAVVDTLDELVSGVGDEAFRSRTRNSSGTLDLLLRINLSCAYRGNLYAFSGPAAAVSSISVNDISEEPDEPETVDLALDEDVPILVDEPLFDDPVTEETPLEVPLLQGPEIDEPSRDDLPADNPGFDDQLMDEPVVDEQPLDQPSLEEPISDEQLTDAPSPDELPAVVPASDEQLTDEPIEEELTSNDVNHWTFAV